jgi:tetratricopeptide (TPR) repeat protein
MIKKRNRGNKIQNYEWKKWGILFAFVFVVFVFALLMFYKSLNQPDTQCTSSHAVNSRPPMSLVTAADFFAKGDYDYDVGNCEQAISDYTKAIKLNPDYPQAYNNRAYTFMRMQIYKAALVDLDKALELNPNYINALMNRGDIHNFYYEIDRQSAKVDYKKVILLGGIHGTSVCGHLFMAEHNGWNFGTVLDFPWGISSVCN